MRILHNEPIDIEEYCGKVVLCYFSEDEAAAGELKKELLDSEFRVAVDMLDDNEALTHTATQEGDRLLDSAGVMVLFLGDSLLFRKNQPKRNLLFHRVGYFCAQGPSALILCSHARVGAGILAGTPLQSASVMVYEKKDGVSNVLKTLREPDAGRDFSRMKKDAFFSPDKVGASERITYRRIGVELLLHRADFDAARTLYGSRRAEAGIGEEEFLAVLERELSAKVHLFSFGSKQEATGQFALYDGERGTALGEYPTHFENTLSLSVLPEGEREGGAVAVLRIGYILPVHTHLGLCCKPYLEGGRGLDGEVLATLLRGNFSPEHDAVSRDERLYYRFNFDSTERAKAAIPSDGGMGRYADIVYPQ